MNVLKKFFIFILILGTGACGGNQQKEDAESEKNAEGRQAENYEKMKKVDLGEYGFDASIYVPHESKGKLSIQETEWGSTLISVGPKFEMELIPFGLSVEEKRVELDGDLVYDVTYLTEEEDLIKYSKKIKDSDLEAEYHFFMNVELDGEVAEIKSVKDKAFSSKDVDLMIQSARSLQ